MSQNTISVSPIPQSTSVDKIKEIFSAFSVKNVHIDGKTAYVEFADQGDLQNLDIQFDNYEVADLNNAKIDKAEFDWTTVHKQTGNFSELKSQSSDKHQDLMAADIDNLIVIENCDQQKLNSLSVESIRLIFKDFHSVNRIVKRNNDVIVEFTDGGEMEKLQSSFNNFNVPQLGQNSQIQKADNQKISPEDFVNRWSKIHNQSMITQESTNLGYQEEKPISGQFYSGNQLGYGSTQEKKSPPHKVLHEDIIPPFDKKTSMEMNFLSEQSKLGYKDEPKHEAIPQATTHQQLDYTTEVRIHDDENKLGYSKQVEEEAQRRQEQERKARQEEQNQRKMQEERRKQQQEQRRKIELQQQQKKAQEEQRRRKQEEQTIKRQNQEAERKRQEEQNRRKKEEQELQRQRQIQQQEQQRRKQQEQQKRKQQEQQKRKQEEQKRKRQEQELEVKQKLMQEKRRKFQQQRLSQQLKQKLDAQKQKFKTQTQKLGYEQEAKKQEKHQMPTESENVVEETQAIREVGQSIEKQLGYAVNMAKAESAHLLQAGLDLLKGTGKEQIQEKPAPKVEKLGYEKEAPKEIGLNLINSGLDFLKGSYQKFQEHFGQNAISQTGSKTSDLGYEKWSVKPDVGVLKPAATAQSKVLRTIVTVTLLIWVIFLLMQDTSQEVHTTSEIEISASTV